MNSQEKNEYLNDSNLMQLNHQNIQDNEELSKIADAYRVKINEVLDQIKQYNIIMTRNKQEHNTVIQKMKNLKCEFQEKNIQLNSQIENAKNSLEQSIKQITEQHQKAMKSLQSKAQNNINEEHERMKALLTFLDIYKQKQIEEYSLVKEIEIKTEALIENQYAHHDNMNVQESAQSQQTNQMIKESIQLIKDLKKNAKNYAQKVVYEEKYENEQKNYELKHRLMVLQEELCKLRKQRGILLQNRKQNKINISINEEELEEYKAVGSLQKSKIKMFQDKIQYTKKSIVSQLGKLQTKIKEKKNKWEGEMKGMKIKLFNLDKKKQQLKNNLQKYKILGETILLQREEVEEFFVMAIQESKKQMMESGPMQENNEKQYGEKVDIDELSPKDRHRILTNLYTKLALGPK